MYAQFARYIVAGAIAAAIYAVVYLVTANQLLPPGGAVFAVVPAFGISLVACFLLHSRWSFAGHGSGDEKVTQPLRFLVVQATGLFANLDVTYIATRLLLAPNWMALVPSLTLTPLLAFALQRRWGQMDGTAADDDLAGQRRVDCVGHGRVIALVEPPVARLP
ncbi:MAG: GtrA family protein [Sandarakinorhabdus sp.]|nr:GtrA family protein [Sandarakinorhabdus sp.]